MTPITKIPPCGAGSPHLNAMDNAPATADPTIQEAGYGLDLLLQMG